MGASVKSYPRKYNLIPSVSFRYKRKAKKRPGDEVALNLDEVVLNFLNCSVDEVALDTIFSG